MKAPDKDAIVQENVRRRTIMDEYSKKPLERARFCDVVPGVTEDPGVCLYNVSHEGRSPVPKNKRDPALRLMGIFRNQTDAVAEAQRMSQGLCEIDYWITPVGQWFMMHVDRQREQVEVQTLIEARLEKSRQKREKDFEELKIAHEQKLQSKTSYQKNERALRREAKASEEAPQKEAQQEAQKEAQEVTQKYIKVGQRFAVISVLQDTLQSTRTGLKLPEPLVRVYGAFDSKKKATNFIKDTLAPYIGDYDMDIVDMYSWLHPQSIKPEDVEEQFRDPEINNIMNHAKNEKKNSKAFRERCALMDKEPDMKHVTGKDMAPTISVCIEEPTQEPRELVEAEAIAGADFSQLKEQAATFYKALASDCPCEMESIACEASPVQMPPALSDP